MKRSATFCTASYLLAATLTAQTPAIPPDYFGDTLPTVRYRVNDGQVIDTDGQLRPDVLGYSEGAPIKLYARENSEVSFVMAAIDADTSTADTLYRIDMAMAAEADLVDPQFLSELPGITNYYYPHTAPDGVTGVTAYKRVVYEGIYPSIDFHLYSGSSGPRMCWVVWPGGDPDDIWLHFEGQDSLHVDWYNTLKLYANGRVLKLDSAKAYQFQGSSITTIGGGAEYIEMGTDDYITFEIESYDPNLPLVIQVGPPPMMGGGGGPIDNLDWSTFMGHGDKNDVIHGAAAHSDGSLFIAGHTFDWDFPPFNGGGFPFNHQHDLFFGHYSFDPANPTLDAVNDFTTWYGGTGEDKARDMLLLEAEDAAIVVGWTMSTDLDIEPDSDPMDGSFWQGSNKGLIDGLFLRFNTNNGLVTRADYFGGEGCKLPLFSGRS